MVAVGGMSKSCDRRTELRLLLLVLACLGAEKPAEREASPSPPPPPPPPLL